MRLIDADAEVKALNVMLPNMTDPSDKTAVEFARNVLEDAPTIDAEPVRHGYWLDEYAFAGMRRCSECRAYNDKVNRHCCGCGAKMGTTRAAATATDGKGN